eukprot:161415-Chlamydomonas_euryale.AAC.1
MGKLSWADEVVSNVRKVRGVERDCMHDATPNLLPNYHEGIIPMLLHYLFPWVVKFIRRYTRTQATYPKCVRALPVGGGGDATTS